MRALTLNYLSLNKTLYFIVICLGYLLTAVVLQELLLHDELYYQALGEQLTYERIETFLFQRKKWTWLGYALIPFIYLIKFFLITTCLFTGAILLDLKVSFKKFFQLTILGETIFLIPVITTVIWFSWIDPNYSLADIQNFYPLSLINFFDIEQLAPWLIYPIQLFNAFELGYILSLSYGISVLTEKKLKSGISFVLSTYGLGLLVWATIVTFIMINLS